MGDSGIAGASRSPFGRLSSEASQVRKLVAVLISPGSGHVTQRVQVNCSKRVVCLRHARWVVIAVLCPLWSHDLRASPRRSRPHVSRASSAFKRVKQSTQITKIRHKSATLTCDVLGACARSTPQRCEGVAQISSRIVKLQNICLAPGSFLVTTESARTVLLQFARLRSVSSSHNVRGIW